MKSVLLLGSILLLSACGSMQSQVVKKNVSFDPGSQAQIRSYGSYGSDLIRIYPETDCAKWEGTKRNAVNRRFVNGLPRKVRNISIGIPPTELSRKTEKDTGFVFRDSYREMVVSADQPVVLDGAFSSQTRNYHYSCELPLLSHLRQARLMKSAICQRKMDATLRFTISVMRKKTVSAKPKNLLQTIAQGREQAFKDVVREI